MHLFEMATIQAGFQRSRPDGPAVGLLLTVNGCFAMQVLSFRDCAAEGLAHSKTLTLSGIENVASKSNTDSPSGAGFGRLSGDAT